MGGRGGVISREMGGGGFSYLVRWGEGGCHIS